MPTRSVAVSPATIVTVLWAAGAVACLLPILVGLYQVSGLRQSAVRWRRGQAAIAPLIAVGRTRRDAVIMVHEGVPGPMTCGILRPAIILPPDAATWPLADLQRAVVHELEHVRRRDWLTQCLARVVCAIYWFHPLVWIARRQLALEAERVCDDAVLRYAEATDYADQLVTLARRLSSASRTTVLAMANRQELVRRVTAVLDPRQPRGRAGARVMAALSVASVVIIGVISPWRMSAAGRRASAGTPAQAAQSPSPATPATGPAQYEAASIKPCDPDASMAARRGGAQRINVSTNRFYIQCVTVDSLIYVSYVRNGDYILNEHGLDQEVRGGADWIRSDRFTVEATAAGKPDTSVLMGSMLRAFLEDRLQLRVHRVAEQIPMYALTVAKGGLKIKPIAEGDCTPDDSDGSPTPPPALGSGSKLPCGMMRGGRRNGLRIWDLTGASFRQLADVLDADRQVLDQTGVTDKFNIHLEYAPEDLTSGADPAGPTMAVALEQQLGLKLISTRGPHEHVVVDHVERPSNR